MKISLKTTGLDLTPSFQLYVESKLGSIAKFIKKFDLTGQAELWVEVARTTRHHHKGEVFMAEADLRLPKKILRASEKGEDARAAVDALRTKLHFEIEKYKTKHSPRLNRRADSQ